ALNAGACCRRARLLIVSPDSRDNLARRQAETPLIALSRFPEPAHSVRILEDGTMPRPIRRGGVVLWDMRLIDRAFEVLSGDAEGATLGLV
ncbi:hypothetical protein ACM43_11240, partial [Bradyrhizobium sp. CCBAU 45321]|nr:hypothetical protein [Bradyrhizobium sp. CCBAU 45321]